LILVARRKKIKIGSEIWKNKTGRRVNPMWPFKKKPIEQTAAPTFAFSIDTEKLWEELREAQENAMFDISKPIMTEGQAKIIVDRWLEKLPEAFERSLKTDCDNVYLWDQGLAAEQFQHAAAIFRNTLFRSFGVESEIALDRGFVIKIKVADLQKFVNR
jgi:hypothetical protein